MKLIILAVVYIALMAAFIEAFPQGLHIQRLPYYPPPSQAPRFIKVQRLPYYRPPNQATRPIRVRRDVLGGQVSTNPAGGNNARLDLTEAIGTPDHNAIAQVFAAGNTNGGPVTTGGILGVNSNGLGASIAKEHTPGVRDSLTKTLNANLFSDGTHSVNAKAFQSDNTLANGFKFERNGQGIDYAHVNGHEASFSQINIPDFGRQLELAGKANLWSSPDRNTRFDLSGIASKWTSGPYSGQKDFEAALGLTHIFG